MVPTHTPEEMLARLVAFKTVVGHSNAELIAFVKAYLDGHGVACRVLPGPEGDRFNLFATIGDPTRPGYVLSGHVDVVPAGEPDWLGDPFALREVDGKLIGRGACDMKGFDAAVLAAVPELCAMNLSQPVHIALSYDEEAGCKGVPHLLAALPELCARPAGCIVGEPTGLTPVLAHKGKAAVRFSAIGRSGHSSRPDLGKNAIHALVPVLAAACTQAEDLQRGPQDDRFQPPWSSLQIGTIAGGQAINIIPEEAEARIEARAIDGVAPQDVLAPVIAAAGEDVSVEWLSSYPALALDRGHPLAEMAETVSGRKALGAVSFGTEAGLFQAAGIPSIICGPGDIARAHRPEEYLTRDELRGAFDMVVRLGQRLAV
ncbi:acetylornithine deacetylase [Breoghania sp. JC706]|uniref:acetylornithine deacetylase n=1 Tax=Breoghania sp. JC706 TaxID=3117732 RepID=UPI00300B7865